MEKEEGDHSGGASQARVSLDKKKNEQGDEIVKTSDGKWDTRKVAGDVSAEGGKKHTQKDCSSRSRGVGQGGKTLKNCYELTMGEDRFLHIQYDKKAIEKNTMEKPLKQKGSEKKKNRMSRLC